jgi:hypothetical protein
MPDINFIRAEIEHMRRQVERLRDEISQLQHSGISSVSAEALLDRMLDKIDDVCAERQAQERRASEPSPSAGDKLDRKEGASADDRGHGNRKQDSNGEFQPPLAVRHLRPLDPFRAGVDSAG